MEKNFLRICSFVFALIFVCRANVSAIYEDSVVRRYSTVELIQNGDVPITGTTPMFLVSNNVIEFAEKLLVNGLQNAESEIDLSTANLPMDNLKDLYQDVMNSHPELFYVDFGYSYTCDNNGFVEYVNPTYKISYDKIEVQKTQYFLELKKIVSQINLTLSDLEKVVFVHDYLCANFSYDKTESIFDAYSFLSGKTGVCQSYSLAFIAIMNELDIAVGYASSDSMNHIWNVVEIDGLWYHVDITWDDTYKQTVCGQVKHKNLLLSDYGIKTTGHRDWVTNIEDFCSDSTYDTYLWNDISMPFVWVAEECYTIVDGTCYMVDLSSGELCFFGIDTEWLYSGIASYDDTLLVGYKNSIKAYDTEGMYLYDLYISGSGSNIYGLNTSNGVLSFAQSNKFSSDLQFNQTKWFLTKNMFSVDVLAEIYDGTDIEKDIQSDLIEGTSYNAIYDSNDKTGVAKIELFGINEYCGKLTYEFYICDKYMLIDNVNDLDLYINLGDESLYYNLISHSYLGGIYGTGAVLHTYTKEDNKLIGAVIVVINGDTNGDSVCDALDAAQVANASNGLKSLDGAYAMAADSNQDDEIDIMDYQAIVNKVIA